MSQSGSRRRQLSPLYLLLFLAAAAILYLYNAGALSCIGLLPPSQVTAVEITGNWVQAFFTSPDFSGSSPQQGGLDARVAADIEAARQSVDVAAFDFDLESITRALLNAYRNGVRVRMVIDSENLASEEVKRLTDELTAAGIPIVYDNRQAFMHDKFVIIDRQILWTGSWNLTQNGTYLNNNNALRLTIPQLAENYTAEFEEMFLDGDFGPKSPADTPYPVLQLSDGSRIETCFSPEEDTAGAIVARLRDARQEIVVMAFSFTDDEMSRVLLEKAREGVSVRGVFESRNATTEYSEYGALRDAGLDVRLDGNPRVMHHKVMVIDGWVTITGSYNFTSSAAEDNDENVLIIENAELARSYLLEFDRVYQAGYKE